MLTIKDRREVDGGQGEEIFMSHVHICPSPTDGERSAVSSGLDVSRRPLLRPELGAQSHMEHSQQSLQGTVRLCCCFCCCCSKINRLREKQ